MTICTLLQAFLHPSYNLLLPLREPLCNTSIPDSSSGDPWGGRGYRRPHVRHQCGLRCPSAAAVGFQLRWGRNIVDVRVSRSVVLELHRAKRAASRLAYRGQTVLLLAHRIFQPPGELRSWFHTQRASCQEDWDIRCSRS